MLNVVIKQLACAYSHYNINPNDTFILTRISSLTLVTDIQQNINVSLLEGQYRLLIEVTGQDSAMSVDEIDVIREGCISSGN